MAIRLVVFSFFAFLLSSCEATTSVDVVVEEDGSGLVAVEVALDRAAADGLLDLEGDIGLWLDDVSRSGWTVEAPRLGDDGMTRVGATKAFGTPAQFSEIMDEITGDAGLFDGFTLVRSKEFARVRYVVKGSLHPSGIESFGDEQLVASLGRTLSEIVVGYGGDLTAFDVALSIEMPGHLDETVVSSGDPVPSVDDVAHYWRVNLADSSDVEIVMGSTTTGVSALVWRGVAVILGVLALLVALGHLLRVLRPSGRRGRGGKAAKPRPSARGPLKRAPSTTQVRDAAPEEDDDETDEVLDAGPAVVALDGMGVLYREGSDTAELLVPFVWEMGSTASREEITSRARAMSLGRLAPMDFWKSVGLDSDPNDLDDQYLSRHQLNPGVVKFLRELRERGVQVACVTNDCVSWANKLNARHSLDGLIDPWIVSGAVGVRKPDAPIYEVLRRVTGQPAAAILVVDDELDNLDSARELGFRTAWFAPSGDAAGARGHAILRSFSLESEAAKNS